MPVRPSVEPARRYEYYEALADVEIALEESEHLTVLLLPTVPEGEDQTEGKSMQRTQHVGQGRQESGWRSLRMVITPHA